jgi:prepilin-type processing-associated H-X9-DG protein
VYNHNGLIFLLPYLEQENHYRGLKLDHATSHVLTGVGANTAAPPARLQGDAIASGNGSLISRPLSCFICPSEVISHSIPGESNTCHIKLGSGVYGAKTNYDFSSSHLIECNEWRRFSGSRRMFGENSTTRIADVTDGTSNTVAMAETTLPTYGGHATNWGFRGFQQMGLSLGTGGGLNRWFVNASGRVEKGHRMGPQTAGSYHPGGANVFLADGSVRFLKETMTFGTRESLATMAGGEVVSLD